MHVSLRAAWARRVLAEAPEARSWVGGALALLVAHALAARRAFRPEKLTPALLGTPGSTHGLSPPRRLPAEQRGLGARGLRGARRPLARRSGLVERVERDAEELARGNPQGRGAVVGVVALLAVDARRASLAVAAAARGDALLAGGLDASG